MSSNHTRRRSGQALVEMALILPALLLVAVGILEFGRAFNTKQVVTDAAREGARLAVVPDGNITQDSVRSSILTTLRRAGIPSGAATIGFDGTPGPTGNWRKAGAMQTVYVSAQYRFGFFGPFLKAATGSETMAIASRVSMRNQP